MGKCSGYHPISKSQQYETNPPILLLDWTYKSHFCQSHADLLGIFVHPFTSDVVSLKQSWNPLDHLHLTLASQLSLFFLEQELLLCCRMLVRTRDRITHSDPQPTRRNKKVLQLFEIVKIKK